MFQGTSLRTTRNLKLRRRMKFRALIKIVQRTRSSVILEPRLFMETVEYDWSLLNKVRPLELQKGPTSLSRSALISRITATEDRIPTEEDIYLLILSSLDYGCSTDPPSDRDNNISHSRGIPSKTAPPGEG